MSAEQDATVASCACRRLGARVVRVAVVVAQSAAGRAEAADRLSAQPFRLTLDARGRAKLVEAPTFPEAFQAIGDPANYFTDFFSVSRRSR